MPTKHKFNRDDQTLAGYAKALSAPAKVAILRTLAQRKNCICGEIVKITPLSQSTVSQHLKELKELGLIQGTIQGVKSCYCIDPDGFARFKKTVLAFFDDVEFTKSRKR